MESADADPALGTEGCGADQADSNQARHGEAVQGNQQPLKPLKRDPLQNPGHHDADCGGDPVVVPVRVISLTLGAGDQNA